MTAAGMGELAEKGKRPGGGTILDRLADHARERVEEALSCIDLSELREMIAEGQDISVSCQFCDKVYSFSVDELHRIAEAKSSETGNVTEEN